jgi:hypothetical protein
MALQRASVLTHKGRVISALTAVCITTTHIVYIAALYNYVGFNRLMGGAKSNIISGTSLRSGSSDIANSFVTSKNSSKKNRPFFFDEKLLFANESKMDKKLFI